MTMKKVLAVAVSALAMAGVPAYAQLVGNIGGVVNSAVGGSLNAAAYASAALRAIPIVGVCSAFHVPC